MLRFEGGMMRILERRHLKKQTVLDKLRSLLRKCLSKKLNQACVFLLRDNLYREALFNGWWGGDLELNWRWVGCRNSWSTLKTSTEGFKKTHRQCWKLLLWTHHWIEGGDSLTLVLWIETRRELRCDCLCWFHRLHVEHYN